MKFVQGSILWSKINSHMKFIDLNFDYQYRSSTQKNIFRAMQQELRRKQPKNDFYKRS